MGYCINLLDSSIHIKKKQFTSALEAVKVAFSENRYIQTLTELEDAIYAFYYVPEFNHDGDICGINYEGEKLRDDEIFWSALAPYVEDGGFIEMGGEDCKRWRWVFKNGKCKEIQPAITWEGN